jgi:DNA-binding MarR family transcriptional regulator
MRRPRGREEAVLKRDVGPLEIVRHAMLALVLADGRDLTARQITVLLTCYLEDTSFAVSELAARLRVSKPAITRALDRLEELQLLKRADKPQDRRVVLLARTEGGMAFMGRLRAMMEDAARRAGTPPAVDAGDGHHHLELSGPPA